LNLGDNFFSGSLPNEVDIKIITSSTTSTSTNKDNGYNNNDDDNSAEHEDIEVLSTPIVKKIIKSI